MSSLPRHSGQRTIPRGLSKSRCEESDGRPKEYVSCVRANLSMSSAYCHTSILATTFLSPSAVPCVFFFVVIVIYIPHLICSLLVSCAFTRSSLSFAYISSIVHLTLALTGAMYSRKRPDSHRFMGGRSHVFCFDLKSSDTCLFSTTVKVVGTVAHQWKDLIICIQRSRTPFVFEICLIPSQSVFDTDAGESWHTYVSVCRTFAVVFHSTLPHRCTYEAQCPYARSLSANLSPCYPFFLLQYCFSLDATLKCMLLAVVLS